MSPESLSQGGGSVQFEQPLSLGIEVALLSHDLSGLEDNLVRLIREEGEFEIVRSAGEVGPDAAALLRGLRGVLEAGNVQEAVRRMGWLLFEQGRLEEQDSAWLSTVPELP